MFALKDKTVFVAGHRGMVGSAISRRLATHNDCTLVTASRQDLDLRDQPAVQRWFAANRPDVVFLAAAKVGGIQANTAHPAEFIYDNLMIQSNVIEASRTQGVEKLLFVGSSCIYPKTSAQPISEAALLEGALEPSNEWYAVAKIAGLKLCQAYRRQYGCKFVVAIPSNLYGPNDNFSAESSHVLAALLRRFHEAARNRSDTVTLWGSGKPRREFLHVDDLADAAVYLMEHYDDEEHVNVGTGVDVTIDELAREIMDVVGYEGTILHDTTKPDGIARKLLDVSRLSALGWRARIHLPAGLRDTYRWFVETGTSCRA